MLPCSDSQSPLHSQHQTALGLASQGPRGPNHLGRAFPRAGHSCQRVHPGRGPSCLPCLRSGPAPVGQLPWTVRRAGGGGCGRGGGSMGSGCGQGWRGCTGRGSSRRLGRSGQQRGGGLAGAHWSMLNRGADEAGPRKTTGQGGPPACGWWLQQRQAGRTAPTTLQTV